MIIVAGNFIHAEVESVSSSKKCKTVIVAPCVVVAAALLSSDARRSVVLATRDKRIWCVPLTDSREEKIDTDKDNASEDIFGDLLQDGVEVHRRTEGASSKLKQPTDNEVNNKVVCLSSQDLVVSLDCPVLDLLVVGNLVCVLTSASGGAVVRLYRQDVLLVRPAAATVAPELCIHTGVMTKLLLEGAKGRLMHVAVLREESGSLSDDMMSQAKAPLCLGRHLFTSLFGTEATILKSPVLMLSTANGFVFSYPIKLSYEASLDTRLVTCQLDHRITSIVLLKVTHGPPAHSEENSAAILALENALLSVSPEGQYGEDSEALCVCSESGNCCLFLPSSHAAQSPAMLRFSTTSPINCCVFKEPYLVYSTGHSIEACKLTVQRQPGKATDTVLSVATTLSRKSAIVQLVPGSLHSMGSASKVTGITGNLDVVSISVEEQDAAQSQSVTGDVSLRSVMEKIKESSVEVSEKKSQMKEYDSYIQQLNIFASLLMLWEKRKKKHSSSTDDLIACTCRIISQQDGYSRKWFIEVKLKTNKKCSFSSDWLITVSVDTFTMTAKHKLCTFSYPLVKGLDTSSSMVLSIPLENALEAMPWGQSELSVIFTLKSAEFMLTTNCFDQNVKGLKVEVHREVVDAFHFLSRLDIDSSSSNSPGHQSLWLHEELIALSQSRERHGEQSRRLVSTGTSPTVEAAVLIPDIRDLALKDEEAQRSEPVDILKLILHNSNMSAESVMSPSCQLEGPDGVQVTISVDHCGDMPTATCSVQEKVKFVVTLRSSDAILVAQLRNALVRRVKSLMEQKDDASLEPMSNLKTLLSDLQRTRQLLLTANHTVQAPSVSDIEAASVLSDSFDKCKHLSLCLRN
ncbi:uncharacterized protein LOC101849840 [Aplysia californica]|uniref:Uncharacterized protein LOC101849840 n=1 Tax=Aplysia californica TaxID=6500 RepID=A0ABM0JMI1_APLCA|nr:uncharacterized protein LOC101849840 [Aplysia californica]